MYQLILIHSSYTAYRKRVVTCTRTSENAPHPLHKIPTAGNNNHHQKKNKKFHSIPVLSGYYLMTYLHFFIATIIHTSGSVASVITEQLSLIYLISAPSAMPVGIRVLLSRVGLSRYSRKLWMNSSMVWKGQIKMHACGVCNFSGCNNFFPSHSAQVLT